MDMPTVAARDRWLWLADIEIRRAGPADIETLWLVLYFASHSNDEPGVTPADTKQDPYLARYVADWGRQGDLGVIAEGEGDLLGAAWVRLLVGEEQKDISFVDGETPELAVAVLPGFEGRGIGTALLTRLIELARGIYPGIVLTSRAENPAVRLYERLGFRIVDRVVNRVGTESVKMVLAF